MYFFGSGKFRQHGMTNRHRDEHESTTREGGADIRRDLYRKFYGKINLFESFDSKLPAGEEGNDDGLTITVERSLLADDSRAHVVAARLEPAAPSACQPAHKAAQQEPC